MAERVKVTGDLFHGRIPAGAVYVGRAAPGLPRSRWANPFRVGKLIVPPIQRYDPAPVYVRDAAHAVKLYRRWLTGSADRCADLVPLLSGRNLACWCPLVDAEGNPVPCHADVLLALANTERSSS